MKRGNRLPSQFWHIASLLGFEPDEATLADVAAAPRGELPFGLNEFFRPGPEFVELSRNASSPALEICASAPMLLELLPAGSRAIAAIGLAPSAFQESTFRATEWSRGLSPPTSAALEREPDLKAVAAFSLVVIPLLAVCRFSDPGSQFDFLKRAAGNLDCNGRLVFDYLSPTGDNLLVSWPSPVPAVVRDSEGAPVAATQIEHISFGYRYNVCWRQCASTGGAEVFAASIDFALVEPVDVRRMLADLDLVVVDTHRSSQRTLAPLRNIVTCSRRVSVSYPLWHPYSEMNELERDITIFVEGRGANLADSAGNRYIDMAGGLWANQCGLGVEHIVDAITSQLRTLGSGTLFGGRGNRPALDLAIELTSMAPFGLQRAYLTGSGSESVELALKIVRQHFFLKGYRGKTTILYLEHSYHGTFFGSLGVSGIVSNREPLEPGVPGLVSVPFPHPDWCSTGQHFQDLALESARNICERMASGADSIAALIIEPVLGSAGVVLPPVEFFDLIQRSCRRNQVLLIVDEVATGFGRTGRWFASDHFRLHPDLLLLAKGITSGYLPMGAALFTAEVAEPFLTSGSSIIHGSSHNGSPVCSSAALATLQVIREEQLLDRAITMGAYFTTALQKLSASNAVRSVRSLGLMVALALRQEDASPLSPAQLSWLVRRLKSLGVLVYTGPSCLVFMPPLVISAPQIDAVVLCLDVALRGVRLCDDTVASA
jgi:adenosylmethionine-8-amino-7-oxononanoate aminotransferase